MSMPGMMLQTYPIVECLAPEGSDYQSAMLTSLCSLIGTNLSHPSLKSNLLGIDYGLEVTQPIFQNLPALQVRRLEMHATTDPYEFLDRLGSFPNERLPMGFVVAGAALAGLNNSDSYKGIQAVNPANLVEGRLYFPFKHRDRFEKALLHLCGSSTRLSLGLYIPSSSSDEILARRLKVQLSKKFPVVVPAFTEVNSSSPEDIAQIVAQTLKNNQDDLFGPGRGIF